MAKKKKAERKNPEPTDMIHFRPGSDLGSLIGELADKLDLSRGEVSKRMTALAIRGLDQSCYGSIDELSSYLYGGVATFDEAAHYAYVYVSNSANQKKCEVFEMTREETHQCIREVLELNRNLRQHEDNVENKRVHIKVHLTE